MANFSAAFGDAIFGDISFAALGSGGQSPVRSWVEVCPVISEWNDEAALESFFANQAASSDSWSDAPALDSGFVNQQIASSDWAKQDIDSLSFKRCRR